MNSFWRTEYLIRQYVVASQPPAKKKIRFKISRADDVLASGYVEADNKHELARIIKSTSLHYPTEQELEEQNKRQQGEYNRRRAELRKFSPDIFKPSKKKSGKKKVVSTDKTEKAIVEVKEEDYGKLCTESLPRMPKGELLQQ